MPRLTVPITRVERLGLITQALLGETENETIRRTAEILGVSPSTVKRWVSFRAVPSPKSMDAIERVSDKLIAQINRSRTIPHIPVPFYIRGDSIHYILASREPRYVFSIIKEIARTGKTGLVRLVYRVFPRSEYARTLKARGAWEPSKQPEGFIGSSFFENVRYLSDSQIYEFIEKFSGLDREIIEVVAIFK
jgi:DNA-binding transcriptional regulator YdaS (Cro superfamily)